MLKELSEKLSNGVDKKTEEKTPEKSTDTDSAETPETPESADAEKKKKDKKKKWSFRSLSFSKKDKSKPEKTPSKDEAANESLKEEVSGSYQAFDLIEFRPDSELREQTELYCYIIHIFNIFLQVKHSFPAPS